MRPIAFEVSGLMCDQPSGIARYGLGLIRGYMQHRTTSGDDATEDVRLLHPVGRWRRRTILKRRLPGLSLGAYGSGYRLASNVRLLHLLDTRLPARYSGPLVATIFDTLSLLPLASQRDLSPSRFRRRKAAAYEQIVGRADVIVTLAETIRQAVLERFGSASRVEVIPPGLDVPADADLIRSELLNALSARGIRPPFIMAAGALCPRKNLDTVIATFHSVAADWPQLRLVLAGAPDFGWEGSATQRAASSSPRVVVAGYLPRGELWAAMAQAECVLQLSHYEGFGLTVLEAQSVGTPVLVARRGALAETAGTSAWIAEPDDSRCLESHLREILSGGGAVEARVRAGRERALGFTWSRAAAAIAALHESVLT